MSNPHPKATRTILALLGAGLLCAIILEGALRIHVGFPLLSLGDVRGMNTVNILQTGGALYDSDLGWAQMPGITSDTFNTVRFGIRKNSRKEETLSQGAILAVGDSYTAGSQVADNETWPAQLEQQLGQRVLNAGVGGYGLDQIVLSAERLLPVVKPRAVIVGLNEEEIPRTAYKTYSTSKPYFVEEAGTWVLKNHPVPIWTEPPPEPLYKSIAAHFAAAHLVFNRVAHDWWFSMGKQYFDRSDAEPTRVTCHLLDRLQARLKADHIPGIVVAQYSGWSFSRSRPREAATEKVLSCARHDGYTVVDPHDPMMEIAQRSISELKRYYVMSSDSVQFGHMSKLGNRLIASLIAAKYRDIDLANNSK